jgi:tetratricopeptide (TPR) repeat protein
MVRSNLVVGVFVSSLLALLPAVGIAQIAGQMSITGTVFSTEGDSRIPNASVMLCDQQGSRLQETVTTDAGEFSFSGVHAERYVLRANAQGFAANEVGVDLSAGFARGVVIALKSASEPAAARPDRPSISAHELSMPQNARALFDSGMQQFKDNNAEAALSDFQSATGKAPGYYEAYYQAGMAFLKLQKEPEAEKQFRKSVEVSGKKYADADIALATLLLEHGDHEAETLLRQGLALNPQSWNGQVELAKLELSRGRLEPALAAAEKAQAAAPLQPMVYRVLSVIHLKENNYSALKSDLDHYIQLDPDSPAGVRAKDLLAQVEREFPQSARTASK